MAKCVIRIYGDMCYMVAKYPPRLQCTAVATASETLF